MDAADPQEQNITITDLIFQDAVFRIDRMDRRIDYMNIDLPDHSSCRNFMIGTMVA